MIDKLAIRNHVGILSVVMGCVILASSTSLAVPFDAEEIIVAFKQCHDGFSTDELLIRDDLRDSFLAALRAASGEPIDADAQRSALLSLLRLRKSGKLTVPATKRGNPVDPAVHSIAEIAARAVTDRHRITTDVMLVDPDFRGELQREAELISPGIDPYSVRKSVLSLRKKRALRPELVLQVAQWDRKVMTQSLAELRHGLAAGEIPSLPGIYLFRNSEGYLYIGEAVDLSVRLNQHVTESDRPSLAKYLAGDDANSVSVELHIFAADSPAAKPTIRRAYESELIRSRQSKIQCPPLDPAQTRFCHKR